jgi:hypothetical protein
MCYYMSMHPSMPRPLPAICSPNRPLPSCAPHPVGVDPFASSHVQDLGKDSAWAIRFSSFHKKVHKNLFQIPYSFLKTNALHIPHICRLRREKTLHTPTYGGKSIRFDSFFFKKRIPLSVPCLRNYALVVGRPPSLRNLELPLKFSLLNLPHSGMLVAGSG